MKKALVVSFPRSGTHFLMNTLGLNFGYDSEKFVNLESMGYNFWVADNVHWAINKIHINSSDPVCIKSHHDIEFFEPKMEDILDICNVFYIYRNTEDVMNSYCKHLNALPWMEGPTCKNGEELTEAMPIGGMLRYQYQQYMSMGDKHWAHIAGWNASAFRDSIIYVKYEDLNENFQGTTARIAERLGMPVTQFQRPRRDKQVVKDGQVFRHVA